MITKMGMPFGGLKKAGFSGSHKGMRFFVKSLEEGKITAYVYPEPNSFANTPDELKTSKEFEYSEAGIDDCIAWLNQMYEDDIEKWTEALNHRNDAV